MELQTHEGVPRAAVAKHVLANFDVDRTSFRPAFRAAVARGVEEGVFIQENHILKLVARPKLENSKPKNSKAERKWSLETMKKMGCEQDRKNEIVGSLQECIQVDILLRIIASYSADPVDIMMHTYDDNGILRASEPLSLPAYMPHADFMEFLGEVQCERRRVRNFEIDLYFNLQKDVIDELKIRRFTSFFRESPKKYVSIESIIRNMRESSSDDDINLLTHNSSTSASISEREVKTSSSPEYILSANSSFQSPVLNITTIRNKFKGGMLIKRKVQKRFGRHRFAFVD